VLFALLLLSESLSVWEIAGGAAIAVAIALERVAHRASGQPAEAEATIPA
jgi:drug/metabolite transporter (DMT)-like permease